jgi:alkylation response protein AidB-like acyl-CoA dehydrogenase
MSTRAERNGDDYVINGVKHFISHADMADYVVLFAATGEEQTERGPKKKITAFLVDKGTKGFTVRDGYKCVSHRGYHNSILEFDDCRVPATKVLGEEHLGFDVANQWLSATRLQIAAGCVGRGQRALDLCTEWAATRRQFGQSIGKFQGTSFKLADMAMELKAAELLMLETAWRLDQGSMDDQDAAMAKLFATEMLARLTDNAVQIFGGMGLMDELPLERLWRDARVERIWEGTSEIQRHIISRSLLRPHESDR